MNFNSQPTLESESVFLRPLNGQDFESLYQVAKDPFIWEQHPNNDRYKRDVFKIFFKDSIESKGALLVIEKENNQVIGSSRFKRINGVETAIEIGWSFLTRKYWGGHYNKFVKTLMINHVFNSLEDVIFYIGKDNIRSQRAVEKIGAIRITKSKYQHLIRKNENEFTYQISKNEWEN